MLTIIEVLSQIVTRSNALLVVKRVGNYLKLLYFKRSRNQMTK